MKRKLVLHKSKDLYPKPKPVDVKPNDDPSGLPGVSKKKVRSRQPHLMLENQLYEINHLKHFLNDSNSDVPKILDIIYDSCKTQSNKHRNCSPSCNKLPGYISFKCGTQIRRHAIIWKTMDYIYNDMRQEFLIKSNTIKKELFEQFAIEEKLNQPTQTEEEKVTTKPQKTDRKLLQKRFQQQCNEILVSLINDYIERKLNEIFNTNFNDGLESESQQIDL